MGSISEWWEQRRVSEPEDMTKKLPNLNNREKADCKKKKKRRVSGTCGTIFMSSQRTELKKHLK